LGRGSEFGTLERGKLADILVVDGDVLSDISLLEQRSRFIAVMQGGAVKAGQLAAAAPTMVKRERQIGGRAVLRKVPG
jgi:cytosine/adenosine deaminase-related metal-dependent hydrolase